MTVNDEERRTLAEKMAEADLASHVVWGDGGTSSIVMRTNKAAATLAAQVAIDHFAQAGWVRVVDVLAAIDVRVRDLTKAQAAAESIGSGRGAACNSYALGTLRALRSAVEAMTEPKETTDE